jgi:dolichol-phosphate mannosyltransferase
VNVSVVVPCFDEAEGLPQLEARLLPALATLRRTHEVEIILIDDGSRDGTLERLCARFADRPGARVIAHGKNRGLGAAMRTGFAAARGDVVVTLDADCTYAPERIGDLVALVARGAAVATASPYHPDGAVVGVQPWRLSLSLGLSRLYSLALRLGGARARVHTYTSLFRAYRRDVVRACPFAADDYVAVAEVLLRALQQGFPVAELPATLERRRFGQSKLKVLRTIRRHLRLLATILFESLFSRKDDRHDGEIHPDPAALAGAASA